MPRYARALSLLLAGGIVLTLVGFAGEMYVLTQSGQTAAAESGWPYGVKFGIAWIICTLAALVLRWTATLHGSLVTYCRACLRPVRQGERFCPGCGQSPGRTCPKCSGPCGSDARYCAACGAPLGGG